MRVEIKRATRTAVSVALACQEMSEADMAVLHNFVVASQNYIGIIDGKVVCVYGLRPPTLLSNQAYLWLITTPELKGNEFLFIRHSQIAVQDALSEYRQILGHCIVGADQSIRWLKFLGAKFGTPEGSLIPFTIGGDVG